MRDGEITALIKLLEDDNDEVLKVVNEKLIEKGKQAINMLEKSWENSMNQVVQDRIEFLIQKIQFNGLINELKEWTLKGGENLLYGAYLLSKYQYPDLFFSEIEERIEVLKKDVWLEFNDSLTALEKIRILNHILFTIHEYTGNTGNLYSPANSYINQVLETRKGNPVSIAVIYLSVAQSLGMPVYGVNLPRNYILAYKDKSYRDDPDGILFYINPYQRGTIISRKEIEFFLIEEKMELRPEFFRPCSNIIIITGMIRNLYYSYEKMGYEDKIPEIKRMLETVEGKCRA